ELARIAEVNPGAMTRLLDRLESRGLVARAPDPADRRALRIELTEDGRRIARDIAACSQRVRDAALQGMDANQRGLFIRLLEQVRDNLSLPDSGTDAHLHESRQQPCGRSPPVPCPPAGRLRQHRGAGAGRAAARCRQPRHRAPLSEAGFPRQDWWRAFGDPQLDALVAEALEGTPGLAAADARLRRARAQAGLADAARKPAVGTSAQYAVAQLPESLAGGELGGEPMHNALLMLDLDVPLDVWGGKRAEYAAALGEAHAAKV